MDTDDYLDSYPFLIRIQMMAYDSSRRNYYRLKRRMQPKRTVLWGAHDRDVQFGSAADISRQAQLAQLKATTWRFTNNDPRMETA